MTFNPQGRFGESKAMKGLSDKTWQIVRKMYPPAQQEEVGRFLATQCGNNLPFCRDSDEHELERVRFAVLKLSRGNFDKLLKEVEQAQQDWRDTFVAAGFAHSATEHERWALGYLSGSQPTIV